VNCGRGQALYALVLPLTDAAVSSEIGETLCKSGAEVRAPPLFGSGWGLV